MVTVELAVGFVTATLLAVTLAAIVVLGVAQASCARTSAEMARQLARGDQDAAVAARGEAPAGAQFNVDSGPDGGAVHVSTAVPILGVGEVRVSADRWAAWEPGVGSAPPG